MKYQYVIFDFDGVLADTEGVHKIIRSEITAGIAGGRCFPENHTVIGGSPLLEYREMLALYGLTGDPERIAAEHYARTAQRTLELFPAPSAELTDAFDALDALHVPYAVCSSSPRDYLTKILGAWGLLPRFHALTSGDEVARVKPAPDLYRLAIQRAGVPAGAAIAVEDSKTGLTAATAASLPCAGYLPVVTGQDLTGAATILHDLRELAAFLAPC